MRTKFKKLTSLLLAVIMVFGIFTIVPITASAAEDDSESVSETSGDFEYYVDWDERTRIIITGYNGSETDLVVPSTIEGHTVEIIDEYAFSKCTSLKSVTIPSSVDYIWEYAVGYIYDEESSKYKKIDGFTIYGYTNSGAEVYARNNGFAFVSIGEVSPFRYCLDWDETASITNYLGSETDLTIPSTLDGYDVAGIGSYAFDECTSLKSVTIPSCVDYIGEYAVGYTYDEESSEYKKIDGFTIKGYINSGAEVYARNNDFTFVSLGEVSPFRYYLASDETVSITNYLGSETDLIIPSTLDGYTVTGIGSSAFENCTSFVSITIPDSVTEIYDDAFKNCTNLKSVTIPSSVDYIGYCAFGYTYDEENCEYNKIDGFTIYSYTYSTAEVYAKDNGFTFVSLGEGSPYRYQLLYDGTVEITTYYGSETDLTIPSTLDGYIVSEIGSSAFENCTSLESVTIPDSVTIISGRAFANCTSLESVTIPDSVTDISGRAFVNCTSLVSITIPDSVTGISKSAFEGCTSLESVTIPDSVTIISGRAFTYCTSLVSVTIPDSVTKIGGFAFSDCTSLKSVTIPSKVNDIGEYAFGYIYDEENREYKKIDGFTIYGYTNSEAEVYAKDNGFTFVSLGEALPYRYQLLDDGTVYIKKYYGSETDLTIPSTIDGYIVTEIGWSAFENCISLESITIPDSVTMIYDDAFMNCTNLKSVTIPSSVFYIGDYAVGYTYDEENWEYKKIDGFTIYGYADSEAEKYANDNGFTFINLGEVPAPMLGDVDGDGKISIDDVTDIQKFVANMIDFTEEQEALADVDKDEKITIDDVTLIQKNLAGLATI